MNHPSHADFGVHGRAAPLSSHLTPRNGAGLFLEVLFMAPLYDIAVVGYGPTGLTAASPITSPTRAP
ncbi:hypothetical protein [Streptomyces yerevanensis]|uniref:hypothetical protein n=1 Tax=Streptomyces yerevanensis TaxID=66378 RepID=UPI0012FE9D30|nr:hypothetical protein [Streptomyces yerevanensis]